jgi:RNA polymerase sigma-70 factor (ECF subfamily)
VQDVLLGFFMKSPTFVYDPSKGRFRRYLKVCTYHALQRRFADRSPALGKPLSEIDPGTAVVEQIWEDVWEQELLRRAVEEIRRETNDSRTFQAFERCAVHGESPETVAGKMGMHVKSVFRARTEITRLLKARLTTLRAED